MTTRDDHRQAQIRPVGPEPGIAEMLTGALMYSSSTEAAAVLALVHDDDVDPPLTVVLAKIRSLVDRGVVPAPQLVLDELKRTGELTRQVAKTLATATTTGACASAARHYAAATVAESLRRRVESAGAALTSAANTAPEADLAPLVEQAAATIAGCAWRLDSLRGDRP
ncbi:hypothetical protein [Mycobacterium marinum]|uniref:hypothetical protein n=1 Tax=Mycobacterium marinum TaxID=1781 RepID=UPI0035697EB8